MSIRGKAAIVGFAEIPTRREYPGRSSLGLFADVAREAIRDAGLRKEDIDGLITHESTNALTVAEVMGLQPRYTASMTA